ncbi:MAG: class I SAM-dependent methyltransferase [Thermomicrobiales bacterium]|nr:class I SAM-dependent methyltransferase [Thermomicrobiales bacterium]
MVGAHANEVWKNDWLVKRFLDGVRGGIPYANDQIEVMLRMLAASDRPLERFLDLGSGSGLLAIAILSQYPDARAYLVDFSEPMMDAARDLLAQDVSLPRFVLADLGDPTWTERVEHDAPYDAVVSGFAIHHLSHERKQELYREIFALLAPGGMFLNVEHVASTTPWVEEQFDAAVIDSLLAYQNHMGMGRSKEQVAAEYLEREDKAANVLAPVEEQCLWLVDAGFDDVDCYFKYFELAVFGGRRPSEHHLS